MINEEGSIYFFGVSMAFLSLQFGKWWSPDYFNLVNSNYKLLCLSLFFLVGGGFIYLIDKYYNKRK